jgi:hypothetical protein
MRMWGKVRTMSAVCLLGVALRAPAQMVDNTQAPNTAKAGINKSLLHEIGAGRGDVMTTESSMFIIKRDPFRAVRRGRQIFQRKFTVLQGLGPITDDGVGDINADKAIGAGLADSCGLCHGRPRGSGGVGGNVVTRPDSRDTGHLFGLGLKEMLADEITTELRTIRDLAVTLAKATHRPVTLKLLSKGIDFGSITGNKDGSADTSKVQGVDADLRVRPFFAEGSTISIREFVAGALHNEMGMSASSDPDLLAASSGQRVVTPAGMVLDGTKDKIDAPPAPDPVNGNEVNTAIVDYLEFYLMNYFKPAIGQQDEVTERGERLMDKIGCNSCHVQDLVINHDRRVADLETVYDPTRGNFNNLFATAAAFVKVTDDKSGYPALKEPAEKSFVVRNIFTDFKRHDLGPNFHERNWDGTMQNVFLTRALWGVGSTGPYGHDGRSMTLNDVILRHGGEAQRSRDAFAALSTPNKDAINKFLNSLILFPPDDTASSLDPGNRNTAGYPQFGHGSIKLTVLFNDPTDPE